MIIGTAKIYLVADWVCSLKEKRAVVKSLIAKTHNKFNVSIAEIAQNDIHKTIVLGISVVANEYSHANDVITTVINFIEQNTDAVINDVVIEIL